ncbi:HAD family hydrolase [Chryseolinea sp. T2]|uniref:HAD family hydrolase n=1 Tax=Chryseolinea sp. T2 TaxID=3129255 RepID=UPI0030771204
MRHQIFESVAAVFFDIDNTLVARDISLRTILPGWLLKHAPHLDGAELPDHVDQIMDYDRSGFTDRHEFATWIRRRYLRKEFATSQIISDFAKAISENIRRDDSVIDFVLSLRKGYTTGIISNGSGRSQRLKLDRAGLQGAFDDDKIYIEGERGMGKPDPEMLLLPFHEHGIIPDRILFIGDHPQEDMSGAASVGMKTCWIRGHQALSEVPIKPDVIVESIHDLFP